MLRLVFAGTSLACMAGIGEAGSAASMNSKASRAMQPDHLYADLNRFGDHASMAGEKQARSSKETTAPRPDPAAAPRSKEPFGKGFQGWEPTELQARDVFSKDYVKDENPRRFLEAEPRHQEPKHLHSASVRSTVATASSGAVVTMFLVLNIWQ